MSNMILLEMSDLADLKVFLTSQCFFVALAGTCFEVTLLLFYTAKAQRSADLSIRRSLWRGQLKASLCFTHSNEHRETAEVS